MTWGSRDEIAGELVIGDRWSGAFLMTWGARMRSVVTWSSGIDGVGRFLMAWGSRMRSPVELVIGDRWSGSLLGGLGIGRIVSPDHVRHVLDVLARRREHAWAPFAASAPPMEIGAGSEHTGVARGVRVRQGRTGIDALAELRRRMVQGTALPGIVLVPAGPRHRTIGADGLVGIEW